MSETHTCPVEGCEYGESTDKSLNSVKSHINAKGDDRHNWADLAHHFGEGDPPEEETDETDETEESDEETDETDMPTDEEYQAQATLAQADETEGTGEMETDGSEGGFLPALDRSTMMVLAAACGVIVVLYLLSQRDGGDEFDPDESEPADETEPAGESELNAAAAEWSAGE
jgi:hypothetical protein